jgi:hypothetical protein
LIIHWLHYRGSDYFSKTNYKEKCHQFMRQENIIGVGCMCALDCWKMCCQEAAVIKFLTIKLIRIVVLYMNVRPLWIFWNGVCCC